MDLTQTAGTSESTELTNEMQDFIVDGDLIAAKAAHLGFLELPDNVVGRSGDLGFLQGPQSTGGLWELSHDEIGYSSNEATARFREGHTAFGDEKSEKRFLRFFATPESSRSRRIQKTVRNCLSCSKDFLSKSIYDRRCHECGQDERFDTTGIADVFANYALYDLNLEDQEAEQKIEQAHDKAKWVPWYSDSKPTGSL